MNTELIRKSLGDELGKLFIEQRSKPHFIIHLDTTEFGYIGKYYFDKKDTEKLIGRNIDDESFDLLIYENNGGLLGLFIQWGLDDFIEKQNISNEDSELLWDYIDNILIKEQIIEYYDYVEEEEGGVKKFREFLDNKYGKRIINKEVN